VYAVCLSLLGVAYHVAAHGDPTDGVRARIAGTIAYVLAHGPIRPASDVGVARGGGPCALHLADVVSGVSSAVSVGSQSPDLGALSFSPLGDLLLLAEDRSQEVAIERASALWGLDTSGRLTQIVEAPFGVFQEQACFSQDFAPRYVWSPEGSKIATWGHFPTHANGDRFRFYVVDLKNGKLKRWLAGADELPPIGWHPNGRDLLVPGNRDDWQREPSTDLLTALPMFRVRADKGDRNVVFRYLPGCKAIVPMGKTGVVLTLEHGGLVETDIGRGSRLGYGLPPDGRLIGRPVVSPDGLWIAASFLAASSVPSYAIDAPRELRPSVGVALYDLDWDRKTANYPAWYDMLPPAIFELGLIPRRFHPNMFSDLRQPAISIRWTADSKYIVRCIASQWFPKPGEEGDEFADGVVDVIEVETGKRWEIFRVKGHVLNIDWSPLKYEIKPQPAVPSPPSSPTSTKAGGSKKGGKQVRHT